MKPLSNIMGKEIKEMLTLATFVPIIVMAVLFASLGGMIGGAQEQASQAPKVGLIDLDGSNYSHLAAGVITNSSKLVYVGANITEGLNNVSSARGTALLVIEPEFGTNIEHNISGTIRIYWIMTGTGVMDSVSSEVVNNVLRAVDTKLSMTMIDSHSFTNASVVLSPTVTNETTYFKGKTMEGISPGTISGALSSQSFIVPLVVMMVIMMSGGTVIASMGMEKENKTLETLLTMPVKRRDIVVGKLAGAAVVGLIMAAIYMAGMSYYMSSLQGSSQLDMAKYGLVLNLADYALIGLSLFLAVLGALALCMLLGALARDYKSAQGLTMPITFLTMIPFFVLMMSSFDTLPLIGQVGVFLIPFSHPMMAVNNLMFGDYTLVIAGIVYEAIFAGVTMAIAVWLFKKDMLITGRRKRDKKRFDPFGLWSAKQR